MVDKQEDYSMIKITKMDDLVGFQDTFAKHMKDKDAIPGEVIGNVQRSKNFLLGEDDVGFDRVRHVFGFDSEYFDSDFIQNIDISFTAHGVGINAEIY
jgi:hypothetical protein